MNILFSRPMAKLYGRLSKEQREHVDAAIALFRQNPFAPKLYNHALQGKMAGKRSLSAGYDLRIIFVERDGYAVVIMLDVGKHDDVYR